MGATQKSTKSQQVMLPHAGIPCNVTIGMRGKIDLEKLLTIILRVTKKFNKHFYDE